MPILAPNTTQLRDADPRGRLDVALYRLFEMIVRKRLEPALKNQPVWDHGLGDFIEAGIQRVVPSQPMTANALLDALFGKQKTARLR